MARLIPGELEEIFWWRNSHSLPLQLDHFQSQNIYQSEIGLMPRAKMGGMNSSSITKDYTKTSQTLNEADEALFQQAAKEIINIQLGAGIAIPTDGEVRRENYIHYHCRHLTGFDFNHLEHRVLRDGAYETDLPAGKSVS